MSRDARGALYLAVLLAFCSLTPAVVQAQTVTLTIQLAGPSTGTVGVIPSGVLCSSPTTSCPVTFPSGTVVTIVANVPAGSATPPGVFSGGTGSASGCAKTTCSFTITTSSSVTASFDPGAGPFVTITPTLAGDGEGSVGIDNSRRQDFDPAQGVGGGTTYAAGSVVSMTAAPASESRFSGYSAGTNGAAACGASPQCSFTANADAAVTATFHALTSLAVSPASASIFINAQQAYTAMGTFSNGVTEAVSSAGLGTWRTRAVMPTPRYSLAATTANGKIYAIGGIAGSGVGAPSAVVEAYDPAANTWSTAASMPTAREGVGAATVNNLVYAIGGNMPGSTPVAVVERYDPVANTWTARAPLSAPRRFLTAVALNGIIYAIGGETTAGTVATVEAYDPVANTWTMRAPMLQPRKVFAAAVAGGLIYAMGGAATSTPGSVEAYDPLTDTWTARASLPNGRNASAAAVADGVIYAFGTTGTDVSAYDAVRNAWALKQGFPTSRAEMTAASLGGLLYVIGGFAPTNATKLGTVEVLTDAPRWTSSNPAVATISQQASATGIASGTATIGATIGGFTCAGSTCGALTVTRLAVTMALDRTSLVFGATRSGNAFTTTTPPQNVRMTQAGPGTVSWTATPSDPWIHVSPTSGTGSAVFGVSIAFDASLPSSGTTTGSISVQLTGADNSVGPIAVPLSIEAAGTSTAPFGQVDTPLDNATGVVGSLPITGWALDDIGIARVRITRDPVAGEPQGTPIFIGNANFLDGARPDVASQFPNAPAGTAGGWGYLMLTNFLPNQGTGTFRLNVFADDLDGHTTLIGTRTITCANNVSTLPFGAIDTPDQGQTVSGFVTNFGWVLSPGTARADPPGGGTVNVFIDGSPVGSPGGWNARSDLSSLFPQSQFAGVNTALGVFGFDSTPLANGVHTLAWGVADSAGGGAGVGSRDFTVSNGSSLRAAPPLPALHAPGGSVAIAGRRGFDLDAPLQTYMPDARGLITIQAEEIDRIELYVTPGAAGGYWYGGRLRSLPPGSHVDPTRGVFTWNPPVGFVGAYDFVFGTENVRIVLNPKRSNRVGPQTIIDLPAKAGSYGTNGGRDGTNGGRDGTNGGRDGTNGGRDGTNAGSDGSIVVGQPFFLAGWAADLDADVETGVDAVHVWAYPVNAAGGHEDPQWIGAAVYGGARPDVAAVYGARFEKSGYGLGVEGLAPGTYDIAVFAYSTVRGGFAPAKVVRVTVR